MIQELTFFSSKLMQPLQSTSFCWSIIPTMFSIKHSTKVTLHSNHRANKGAFAQALIQALLMFSKGPVQPGTKNRKTCLYGLHWVGWLALWRFMEYIELVGWTFKTKLLTVRVIPPIVMLKWTNVSRNTNKRADAKEACSPEMEQKGDID